MRIRLLFFAIYRDLAGAESLELTLPPGTTAATLIESVRRRGGGFARLPAEPVVAINHEYAGLESPLADGDEVALIPPVAGG